MPLPLVAAPLIAQTATSLAQTFGGMFGGRKARREFENAVAPNYLDSEAYQTAETTANLTSRWAQEGMPEASRRLQEDYIGRAGASALQNVGSLRGAANTGMVAQSLADQYRGLASMDAQQRIANRTQYLGARQNLQNQQKVQADREYGQFLNQQAARLARMTANRQTMNQGIAGLGQAGTLAFQAGITPREFGGFLGGQPNNVDSPYLPPQQSSTSGFGNPANLASYGLQQQGFIPLGSY
jgi:hypothetical protein